MQFPPHAPKSAGEVSSGPQPPSRHSPCILDESPLLLLGVGAGQAGNIDHEFFALRQKTRAREDRADESFTGNPSIALSSPIKSARCIGNSFFSATRRSFSLSARIMGAHVRDAIRSEEHVLGSAQSNSFGPKGLRLNRVARNVSIARNPILRNGSPN